MAANARFTSDVIPAAITANENYEPLRQTNILDVERESRRRSIAAVRNRPASRRPVPIPDDVNEIAKLIGEAGDDE